MSEKEDERAEVLEERIVVGEVQCKTCKKFWDIKILRERDDYVPGKCPCGGYLKAVKGRTLLKVGEIVKFKLCCDIQDEESNLPYSTETLEAIERVIAAVIGGGAAVGNLSLSATSEVEEGVTSD